MMTTELRLRESISHELAKMVDRVIELGLLVRDNDPDDLSFHAALMSLRQAVTPLATACEAILIVRFDPHSGSHDLSSKVLARLRVARIAAEYRKAGV